MLRNLNLNDFELLKELVINARRCQTDKEALELVTKDFGGSALYIQSHKTTFRNSHIFEDYKKTKGRKFKILADRYNLSEIRIRRIIKDMKQPSLF